MAKRNRKDLLPASMKAEKKTVSSRLPTYDRFDRAEKALEGAGAVEPSRAKRTKVVRDAYSMPVEDHELVEAARKRAGRNGLLVTKSEVVRAGLRLIAGLEDAHFIEALEAVEKLKTGRPASD